MIYYFTKIENLIVFNNIYILATMAKVIPEFEFLTNADLLELIKSSKPTADDICKLTWMDKDKAMKLLAYLPEYQAHEVFRTCWEPFFVKTGQVDPYENYYTSRMALIELFREYRNTLL